MCQYFTRSFRHLYRLNAAPDGAHTTRFIRASSPLTIEVRKFIRGLIDGRLGVDSATRRRGLGSPESRWRIHHGKSGKERQNAGICQLEVTARLAATVAQVELAVRSLESEAPTRSDQRPGRSSRVALAVCGSSHLHGSVRVTRDAEYGTGLPAQTGDSPGLVGIAKTGLLLSRGRERIWPGPRGSNFIII